jgi:hypothetical protein
VIVFERLYISPQQPALVDVNDIGHIEGNQASNARTEALNFGSNKADILIMWRNTSKTGRPCLASLFLTPGTRMSPTQNKSHLTGAAFGWLLFLLPKIATGCIIGKRRRCSMSIYG